MPDLPATATSERLLNRLDAALSDVGWEESINLDPGVSEETSPIAPLARENLLPDTPLPTEQLDALTSSSKGAVRLSLMEALCRALESNQALRVERLQPEISNTQIMAALGQFDTRVVAEVGAESRESSTLGSRPRNAPVGDRRENTAVSRGQDASVRLEGSLPTGTDYSLGLRASRSTSNRTLPFYSSALNLNITQSLLRGAGCQVNLVNVRTAENNFVRSLYGLQEFLDNMVTQVQSSYYDLYLAMETLRIRRQAYAVAREQREQVEEFVEVGRSAPLDALAAQAEEAARISDVINAAADLKRQQLEFLRLINAWCLPKGWETRIFAAEPPIPPAEDLVAEHHVRLAQRFRPDVRQAEIDCANGTLEVLRTENGLLPVLDLVGDFGLTGVGDTFSNADSSVGEGRFPNYRVGLLFSYPLQNRAARAAHTRANFQKEQAEQAILNLLQLVQVEVRTAIIEIDRTARLIESTAVTRELRELELLAEVERFRVGRSTQLLVNQAQRDLVTAQLQEVIARVAHMKAYLQLYRADGTVLMRRGIQPIWITSASGVPHR